jgi:uncharacterized membrane protein YeiB
MISIIIGIGITAFLFLYFSFQLNDEHFILKLFLIFFALYSLILIPQAVINENCSLQVANYTTTGNTTINEYETICQQSQSSTPVTFLKLPMWFFRIFVTYFFIYLFWHWFRKSEKLMDLIRSRK